MLIKVLETGSNVWISPRHTTSDVRLRLIACMPDPDKYGSFQSWTPATGGRYRRTGALGWGVRAHVGHTYFSTVHGRSLGPFVRVNGKKRGNL